MRTADESTHTPASARERLILNHLPQVEVIARQMCRRLDRTVCLGDLMSAGALGLIAAVDNFREEQGVKLKSYAEYKIRGAILDSLRAMDHASRSQRQWAKAIQRATSDLEQRLKRPPTDEEVAQELNLSTIELQHRLVEIRNLRVESIDDRRGDAGLRDYDNTPASIFERTELERLLREAIQAMPELERTVLALYYFNGFTLKQIAQATSRCTSQIADIRARSLARLRLRLERRRPPLARAS